MINPQFSLNNGYIQIYMGMGKGKTTASLGLMLRHLGHGGRVLYTSFCKGHKSFISGEKTFFKICKFLLGKRFTFKRFGNRMKWESPENITYDDKRWAVKNWKFILDNYKDYTLIVIDEATAALKCGLITEKRLLKFIEEKPDNIELVLTGREFSDNILDRADLITKMECVKHYFARGVQSRIGVEL